ncbi:MAG: LCP family protein [Caldilineaceae bacterium]
MVSELQQEGVAKSPRDSRLRYGVALILTAALLFLASCAGSANSQSATPEAVAEALPTVAEATSAEATTNPVSVSSEAPTATPIPVQPTNTPGPTPTLDAVSPLSHTVNILLLGSDRRPNTGIWRTDVIMIVALDLEHGRAGVISFPRDIWIDQDPDINWVKINTVDVVGEQKGKNEGPKLLSSVLQRKLGVRIDYFVRFEFESFKQVVDILGGIDVDVDCTYHDTIADEGVTLDLKPGHYHFDGKQAISYARSRVMGGDLDRNRRQQQVIWAIRNKIKETNFITKIPSLYSAVSNSVASDLDLLEIVRLARFGITVEPSDIHGMVVQNPLINESWRENMFVFIADWPAIGKSAQQIFDQPAFEDAVKVGPEGERVYCP